MSGILCNIDRYRNRAPLQARFHKDTARADTSLVAAPTTCKARHRATSKTEVKTADAAARGQTRMQRNIAVAIARSITAGASEVFAAAEKALSLHWRRAASIVNALTAPPRPPQTMTARRLKGNAAPEAKVSYETQRSSRKCWAVARPRSASKSLVITLAAPFEPG